jgi:hypothetical protein
VLEAVQEASCNTSRSTFQLPNPEDDPRRLDCRRRLA